MLAHRERFAGKRVGLVVCGGNIDARLLGQVLLRGLVRDGRVISLRIQIVDQPGVLARLARAIGDAGGNIIEIYHQRLFTDLPAKRRRHRRRRRDAQRRACEGDHGEPGRGGVPGAAAGEPVGVATHSGTVSALRILAQTLSASARTRPLAALGGRAAGPTAPAPCCRRRTSTWPLVDWFVG